MGFSFAASISVVTPILSIFLSNVAAVSFSLIGVVTGAFFVSSAITKMLIGLVAGGRMTIGLLLPAFILLSISAAFYPLTCDTVVLVLLRAIQGIAYAFIQTTLMILALLTLSSAERDKGVGTYAASLSLGALAGPAITSVTVPIVGISNTFFFSSVVGTIGIFGAYSMVRKTFSLEKKWQIIGIKTQKIQLRERVSAILRSRMFVIALVSNFTFFAFFGIILAYAPLYAKAKLGIDYAFVSILFLLYYVSTAILRLSIGKILVKIQKKTFLTMILGLGVLLSILFVTTTSPAIFAAAFALLGVVQGAVFPVGSMLIAEYIEPSKNVLASSIFATSLDVGQGLAPLVVGATVIYLGLDLVFALATALPISATIFVMLLSTNSSSQRKI